MEQEELESMDEKLEALNLMTVDLIKQAKHEVFKDVWHEVYDFIQRISYAIPDEQRWLNEFKLTFKELRNKHLKVKD